jgi:hypothetical protein
MDVKRNISFSSQLEGVHYLTEIDLNTKTILVFGNDALVFTGTIVAFKLAIGVAGKGYQHVYAEILRFGEGLMEIMTKA